MCMHICATVQLRKFRFEIMRVIAKAGDQKHRRKFDVKVSELFNE